MADGEERERGKERGRERGKEKLSPLEPCRCSGSSRTVLHPARHIPALGKKLFQFSVKW